MWEGDKIFLRLLEENVPFFSLKLQYQGRPAGPGGAEWEADCMIPALTLEPLSWDDLPEAAVLWADPAVIRWTNIAAPCTEAGAADRLEHLLDCQRGLPFSTVFALREGRHSGDWPAARRWIRPPDLWAVLPAASRLLGPGLGTCGCGGGTAAPGTAGTGPGAGRHGGREYRQRPNSGAAGLCPHRRPPQGFLPGGADAGYLGLRPPLGWSGGDRLTGTAPCNMKK